MKTCEESFKVNSSLHIGDSVSFYDVPSKKGNWIVHIERMKCGSWGTRISRIIAHHEKFNPAADLVQDSLYIGIDTGQFGIFDSKGWRFDLGLTGDTKLTNSGFVCTSGFGDGTYEAIIFKEKDKSVCIEITFIFTDEEIEQKELKR